MDKSNEKRLNKLFAAHTIVPIDSNRYNHYYTQNLSVIYLKKSSDNVIPCFEHSHPQYEFFFPLTPIPFITEDEYAFFGETGTVYAAASGKRHGIKYEVSDVSHVSIVIEKDYFESILRDKGCDVPSSIIPFYVTNELRTYIELFQNEFMRSNRHDDRKINNLADLICDEIIDAFMNNSTFEKRINPHYQRGMRSAAEFLNDNYDKPISLNNVATMCGFSRNYFTESFRKMHGVTPLNYLTKLRVIKAKQLLITSNYSVQEIAFMCGYEKVNTFISAFKSSTGTTPTEFRNRDK